MKNLIIGQTATTFTASDIMVTNTITAGGSIKGHCITASDTMRAKEDIVAEKDLQVSGNIEVSNNILVNKYISMGAANDFISFGYAPATPNSPSIFKIFSPSNNSSNPQNPGNPTPGNDPTPNLACVLGLNYLSSFPNAISINQNLNNQTAGTGGNLVLGHTGAKGFIESQGGGAGPLNHQGDLFINQTCNRNVLFFGQNAIGFGNNLTNAVSIGGKLNLTENMQIGIPSATNFLENSSKLFIQADAASQANALKIKHSANGTFGLKVVELNDTEKAFSVFKSPNNNTDGIERFSISGDGKTQINATNTDVLLIADGNNANQVNFKVKNNGSTEISNTTATQKALIIKNTTENFLVYGNGQTHVATTQQIGFNNSIMQDNNTRLNIFLNNSIESPAANNGIKFNVNTTTAKLITVNSSLSTTSPFTVMSDGKTRIGGEFSTTTDYMLTVNGKIGARAIKVSIQNPWPDYVFEKNYNLPDLESVEKYIDQNKHLPNIPAAKELISECGLDVAEMQGKQMEKIEEIYLYLIEMKKEIASLRKENEALKKKIN